MVYGIWYMRTFKWDFWIHYYYSCPQLIRLKKLRVYFIFERNLREKRGEENWLPWPLPWLGVQSETQTLTGTHWHSPAALNGTHKYLCSLTRTSPIKHNCKLTFFWFAALLYSLSLFLSLSLIPAVNHESNSWSRSWNWSWNWNWSWRESRERKRSRVRGNTSANKCNFISAAGLQGHTHTYRHACACTHMFELARLCQIYMYIYLLMKQPNWAISKQNYWVYCIARINTAKGKHSRESRGERERRIGRMELRARKALTHCTVAQISKCSAEETSRIWCKKL